MAQLFLLFALFVLQAQAIDPSAFARRVAALDAIAAEREVANSPEARAQAALKWLRAVQAVLELTPIETVDGPHRAWLKANADLVVYDEPGGAWLIRVEAFNRIHRENAATTVAEEIAWLAASNFMPGECEGDHACYLYGLNALKGEYLRNHPRGAHRQQALDRITEVTRIQVADLPTATEPSALFDAARDCDGVMRSLRPLRAAVAGAGAAQTEAMRLLDRYLEFCPARQDRRPY